MNKYEKKPFPWRCTKCGQKTIFESVVDYTTQMPHDGREYTVRVARLKTPKCTSCGRIKLDTEALDTLDDALRREAILLLPAQIQEHRLKANMSQEQLAAALGVSNETVARLESGGEIQSRSLDNLMRLFFGLDQVREILTTQQITTLAG